MGKGRFILITLLALAVLGGLVWEIMRNREPVYEGEPLSFWLQGYDQDQRTETSIQAADQALQHLGTNAIPTLLRLIQAEDPPLERKLFAWLGKQHYVKVHHISDFERRNQALIGFGKLGADGRGAVPDLLKIHQHGRTTEDRVCVIRALGSIGPAAKSAMPRLLEWLATQSDVYNRSDLCIRGNLVWAIGQIHSDPQAAVPELIKYLADNEKSGITATAIHALGAYGADAKPAIPALLHSLNRQDRFVPQEAYNALKQIDSNSVVGLSLPQ